VADAVTEYAMPMASVVRLPTHEGREEFSYMAEASHPSLPPLEEFSYMAEASHPSLPPLPLYFTVMN
jgi:hypothetical protein